VAYPSPVRLQVGQVKSTITLGQSLLFSGNLTDTSGAPLTVTSPIVALESLSGGQWTPITTIPVSLDGSYNYTWKPSAPGAYVIRVHYLGVPGQYFEAFTGGESIQVQNLPATNMTLTSSSTTATAGLPITLTFEMNPFVNGANVTLAYSTNNSTWVLIKSVVMTSQTMNVVWTVVPTGPFVVQVIWSGDQAHSGSSAAVTINRPP